MTMTQAIPSGAQALLHEPPGGDPNKLTLVRALGSLVWDAAGMEYIDCTAQAWSNNLGANDPRVIAAVARQLTEITHARPTFHTCPPRARRADSRHRPERARPGRIHLARVDGGRDGVQAGDAQPAGQPAHPRPAGRIPRP